MEKLLRGQGTRGWRRLYHKILNWEEKITILTKQWSSFCSPISASYNDARQKKIDFVIPYCFLSIFVLRCITDSCFCKCVPEYFRKDPFSVLITIISGTTLYFNIDTQTKSICHLTYSISVVNSFRNHEILVHDQYL